MNRRFRRIFSRTPFVAVVAMTTLLAGRSQQACAQRGDVFAEQRALMVQEYVANEGVENPLVLNALRTVPRHLFVLPQHRNRAYLDLAMDIGFKQTISPPFIVAYMTESLDPQPTDRVLEIGTGSGYQAAVLSEIVKEVYTIEIVEPLGERTGKLLKRLKYDNIHAKIGDGYLGWAEHAPFDKIIVTCSPENVPQPLIDQLKEGGKMIIPLGERYQQVFYLFEKKNGKLEQTKLIPTLFVPMTGQMEELRKIQPDATRPTIVNGSFEIDENMDQLADNWYYLRRGEISNDAYDGSNSIRFENNQPGKLSHMLQGMAIDGSQVKQASISWAMKSENIGLGRNSEEQPGIYIFFFDSRRVPLERVTIGPWLADEKQWKKSTVVFDIPRGAREAILQTGLNGATGVLYLDDISLKPIP